MIISFVGPSPGDETDVQCRLDQILWFWQQVYIGENPGETTWEELGVLRDQVNSLIACKPPDVTQAETLTAYAMILMVGMSNL